MGFHGVLRSTASRRRQRPDVVCVAVSRRLWPDIPKDKWRDEFVLTQPGRMERGLCCAVRRCRSIHKDCQPQPVKGVAVGPAPRGPRRPAASSSNLRRPTHRQPQWKGQPSRPSPRLPPPLCRTLRPPSLPKRGLRRSSPARRSRTMRLLPSGWRNRRKSLT